MDWVSLACCLLAFLLYYNTLDAGFVYDDRRAILSNPDLLPSTPWRNLLDNDFWGTPLVDSGSHGSYRPLCVFTFRLNYLLGGFQPWGYHLVNVLLHCLATALVVRVARAILPPPKTKLGSAIAGLTFASHPIHTEAVAGVVGRADLAACNFYLLSFLVYVAHVRYRDVSVNTVQLSHLPLNQCCVQRCLRLNGVSQVKKTFKKPMRHSTNGHIVTNGYVADGEILSRNNGSYLYNAERANYHNILFHVIDSIKRCNWFGKMEELSASGAIVCAMKFFLSCGIGTWQFKRKQCNNINNNNNSSNNNNVNGEVKRLNCHIESNGVVSNGTMNGSVNHNGVYHQNGMVKCSRVEDGRLGAECGSSSVSKVCSKCKGSSVWGWKCHGALLCCILLATAATLSKETGITALAACALYDLVRAAQDATWNNKRRIVSLGMLFAALIALLAARVPLSATPKFARADNPTAREPSIITRFLTFYYLPVFNFFLIICPSTLSFDWSMDAVPRITSVLDPRNCLSLTFYYMLTRTLWKSGMAVYKQGETKTRYSNSLRKDSKIHSYGYPKNGSNGSRCLKVNRNGLIYQFNSLCSYTSVLKSSRVLVSNGRINGKTLCHCSCCRHTLTDHHTSSCRAINNNNSMTHNSTCTCTLVSVASVRPPPTDKPRVHARKTSHSALLLAASFLTLPFLPATNLFFYVGFVVAERVLYLPSVGFCLLLGIGGAKVGSRVSGRARATVLGALVLVLSARTLLRNRDWRDEESLYRSAIRVNPPKAFGNLGSVLSGLGRVREAEAAYHEALRHRPNMADVHYNLGVLLQGRRQYEEAIQSFERAIHFRPSLALAYVNMGASLSAVGRCSEAVSVLSRASRLDGAGLRDARTHAAARAAALQHLGALHAAQGRHRRALQDYKDALAAKPPDFRTQKLYALMSEALVRLQRWPEADRYRKAAIHATESDLGHLHRYWSHHSRSAEVNYRRSLIPAPKYQHEIQPISENTKKMKVNYGLKVQHAARKVLAARNKDRSEVQTRIFSSILKEPGIIVSNCRNKESPKSCCP